MSVTKTLFSPASGPGPFDRSQAERQLALEYLAEAWNSAEEDGLESASLAHASLFAALATFVRLHGDEATADLVSELTDHIRNGEYNLDRVVQ
ncbi:hypothetical protein IC608_08170 [Devosia sp. PTR5]|uniref:Uncharacterized protein n=1 Tax=Devosia oryzisoli TaxID=2774138 RepID=A0A927IT28_9HYPH|nr:hypothetical protein [Devosia oryzisoli]MBD8065447.1 hypothetical protein [Devosia oryzisoli]